MNIESTLLAIFGNPKTKLCYKDSYVRQKNCTISIPTSIRTGRGDIVSYSENPNLPFERNFAVSEKSPVQGN